MVDVDRVKGMLLEWLVCFGTRKVSAYELVDKIPRMYYDNTGIWSYLISQHDYIALDLETGKWHLTDKGIKLLQQESDSV
jgi:hypothetical protein